MSAAPADTVRAEHQSTADAEASTSARAEPVEGQPPRHPAIELLARYRAIFSAVWQVRDQLAGPARMADEAAFLPAALSLQESPVHPAPRRFALAIMALFIIALVWTIFGKIDIVAVAPGRIVVSERTKLVQPLERSVVKSVLVKDGDHVQAGQPLVKLDPTAANADKANVGEQFKAAESDVLRSRALLAALPRADSASRIESIPKARFPSHWSSGETVAAQAQLAAEWSDITAKLGGNHRSRRTASRIFICNEAYASDRLLDVIGCVVLLDRW